jgi:hypothetical protein
MHENQDFFFFFAHRFKARQVDLEFYNAMNAKTTSVPVAHQCCTNSIPYKVPASTIPYKSNDSSLVLRLIYGAYQDLKL